MFRSLLRSTKTFPRGLDPQRRRRKRHVFRRNCVSSEIYVHRRRHWSANSCVGPSPIPAGTSWHTFVGECLDESAGLRRTGECIDWARSQDVWYGTMPNWDTSLVEDMSGWIGSAYQGFGGKSTFNGDISKWDTGKVTTMYICFIKLLRSTKTLGVGTQRK